MNMHK